MIMKHPFLGVPLLAAFALANMAIHPQAYADGSSCPGLDGPRMDRPAASVMLPPFRVVDRHKAVRDQRTKLDALDESPGLAFMRDRYLDVAAKRGRPLRMAREAQAERDSILAHEQKMRLRDWARGEFGRKVLPWPSRPS